PNIARYEIKENVHCDKYKKMNYVTESNHDLALVVLRKQKESKSAANYQNLLWNNLRARISKELCKEKLSEE
ncbi:35649_t:CDS:2, partial [Gigaspora margarita]